MTTDRRWSSPAAVDVKTQLFRALAVLRVILLANTVAVTLYRLDNFREPVAGLVACGVMSAWTAFTIWAYAAPHRRRTPLLVADLAVTVGMLLSSPLLKGEEFRASVPGFWTMGALLAWAIHYRRLGGLTAGVVLAGVDVGVRTQISQTTYGNAFLLVLGGGIVGYMCESLQRMAVEREDAERAAAVSAERARLSRVVHDGVLQVLALVQRRGAELGGEFGELGRLAGERERELRALLREDARVSGPADGSVLDLTAELGRLERDAGVTVATPAGRVELPAGTVRELVAVVRACLDNVTAHVGEGAPAWVLLQASGDRIEVAVRDEGPGIPEGRLAEAAAQGRLGVAQSICGRMADLGGEARLDTGPWGTEWELVLPRP